MNVAELMQTPLMGRAQIVSGAAGMKREVTWCAADSSLRFDNWIMPGLLLLSTGRDLSLPADQLEHKMLEADISGMALFSSAGGAGQLDVDRNFFDDNAIPLIVMPGKANVVSFSKRFVSRMALQYSQELRQEDWLRDLCLRGTTRSSQVAAASLGYREDCCYFCLYLTVGSLSTTDPVITEMNAGSVLRAIQRRLSLPDAQALAFVDGDAVVTFVPWRREDSIQLLRRRVAGVVAEVRRDMTTSHCRAYVGSRAIVLDDFHTSYAYALETERIVRSLDVHDKVCFYDDWYMHMLLLREPKPILQERMEYMLAPLMDSPELLTTLANYLVFGENLKETAEKTFIHVNTLKYRLKRIQELLGVDLHDPIIRFRLRMAVTISRYLER